MPRHVGLLKYILQFKQDIGHLPMTLWRIGRVDAFHPKGHGFDSSSSSHVGTLGNVIHSQLPVALRREIPVQYPCCVGSASE